MSHSNQDPYQGAILRFVDKRTMKRHSIVLACCYWQEAHDAVGTFAMIELILHEWGINMDDVGYTASDNEPVMVACMRDHVRKPRLPCCPHLLQLTVVNGIDGKYKTVDTPTAGNPNATAKVWQGKGPESIGLLVRKMRGVVSFYRGSKTVKAEINLFNDDDDQNQVLAFLLPNKTRWSGIYLMGQRLLRNAAFMSTYHYEHPLNDDCSFTAAEMQLLTQLVSVLEHFYDATQVRR
jgi:hypothetical protein